MSRSTKDKKSSGRRQDDENEPFLVEEIPASPKIRARRQISQEDPFVIENIPRSPVARGRRINHVEESLLVRDMSGSPVMRGKASRTTMDARSASDAVESPNQAPIWTSNSDIIAGSATIPTAPMIPDSQNSRRNEPPPHEDAPPSYESSIPPSTIGWAMQITNQVPFPLPYSNASHDLKLASPAKCPYPLTMELSPLPKSYLSLDRPSPRSSRPSLSRSPSPYAPKPSYTPHTSAAYYARHGGSPPRRPQYRSELRDERSESERLGSNDQYAYRHGGMVTAIVFVVFMVVLALLVTFLWRRKSRSRYANP